MKNELKNIYSIFPNKKHKTTKLINSNELVSWISLLPCSELYRNMGITEKGTWAVEIALGLCELTDSKSYLYVMVLLEQTMDELTSKLNESLNFIDIPIDSIFPFKEIVKIGFEQRGGYWVELAFIWYDNLSMVQKESLIDSLDDLAKSKRATQKLRQRAIKEIKQLKF